MTDTATILDMCCGSRMFWFDKEDPRALFSDIRAEEHKLCDGRHLVISPDVIADFRALPFADEAFRVLRPHGVLIFKWNETQIPVSQVIALTDVKPVIWQRTGKGDKTHWIIFVKPAAGITLETGEQQ
ncbi:MULTISPECIES: SAM-dependent methyltransferase [Pseudescherichia]|uniref:SAM-dependent methyltransferase n=1 Tax=Pseudescherichia TaxID=2055880 RepID=UPI00301D2BEB